jgi:hypothetical protein
MNKRDFIAGAALAAGLWPAAGEASGSAAKGAPAAGPGLLTVTGAITRSNRGPLDPALDQMMAKQGIRFDKAFVFDAAALQRLPAVQIRPTLEYDAKPHTLKGPLLGSVMQAVGVPVRVPVQLGLRAIDGYRVGVSLADANAWRMIVATEIDGRPLALGGLGPQWAVYDADALAAFRDKPLKERFGLCPWGLYHIEVGVSEG